VTTRVPTLVLVALVGLAAGCGRSVVRPDRATRPYPHELHVSKSVDIQVFRKGSRIQLVNATPRSYRDFELWINQRWMRHVEALPAGGSLELSLWDFYDERGEVINAGGFWRTEEPTLIRLVEIQLSDAEPMIGLITLRGEDED
jgi:hypothetical protein